MKKILVLLLMLVCMAVCACAEEEMTLPQAVLDLCAKAHPGYEIVRYDGWGDETFGQYALILSKDGDNILCMAEKAQGDSSYLLTIDNTNAVYDGDVLPGLLIDTGGDVLFYTYYEGSTHYHAVKEQGTWGDVDAIRYVEESDGYAVTLACIQNGMLYYEVNREDENGNILSSESFEPIPVSDAFEARMLLENFDITAFTVDPEYGVNSAMLPGLAEELLEDGDTLCDLDVKRDVLVLAVRKANGRYRVRIARDYGGGYSVMETSDIGGEISLDALHAGDDQVILHIGGYGDCIFEGAGGSDWHLTSTHSDDGVKYGYDRIGPHDAGGSNLNDGYVYGTSRWDQLHTLDFASLPRTCAQALSGIDQNAYALVNNPNPADRLHLRAKPDKGSYSYGKFYNRTPVQVLERGKTWTKVRIGNDDAHLTGYMMTEFLAFDEAEKAALACAFPQMQLTEGYWENGAPIHAEPDWKADSRWMFENKRNDYIIGVCGDEWYVVLRADGAVGYVPQEAFWEGNG